MAKQTMNGAGYWEYHAAIVPLRFDFVPFGTGDLDSDVKVTPRRALLARDLRNSRLVSAAARPFTFLLH